MGAILCIKLADITAACSEEVHGQTPTDHASSRLPELADCQKKLNTKKLLPYAAGFSRAQSLSQLCMLSSI